MHNDHRNAVILYPWLSQVKLNNVVRDMTGDPGAWTQPRVCKTPQRCDQAKQAPHAGTTTYSLAG